MNETVVINAYIVISIIIAATDILLAVKSFKKNKTKGMSHMRRIEKKEQKEKYKKKHREEENEFGNGRRVDDI